MRKAAIFIVLAICLSSCSGCAEERRAFGAWTNQPAKEMSKGEALFLLLIAAIIAHSSHTCNCDKKP